MVDLSDLPEFMAVVRAGGFRDAARATGRSASGLSEAVRRLEARLDVRLLNRTTRSISPTEAGERLIARLAPALLDVEAALGSVDTFRDRPAGTLRLNVPVVAARLVLPRLLPPFLAAFPGITVEVVAEDSLVDILASGCDAGIRFDESLEQDMIAVPIGPRQQSFATGAAPSYLARRGRPQHPRDLLEHDCMRARFSFGLIPDWEFERDGETVKVQPKGPLIVSLGNAIDLAVEAAVAGCGIIQLFEEWLRPYFDDGRLVPLLEDWQERFSGPFLYYPGRRHLPPPLRAFADFARENRW